MKFQVSSAVLSNTLQVVGRVINPKNPRDIMQCFCMKVEGKELIVTATDTEITLTASVELIEAEKNFSFCINAERLLSALREIPEQPLSFDIDEETFEMTMYYMNGKYTLMGIDSEDFPQRGEKIEEIAEVRIIAEALSDSISKTLFAASSDDFKPIMCGLYVDVFPDKLTFVTTDTHRLIRYTLHNFCGDKEGSFILPKRPANLLKSILPKNEVDVIIKFDNKRAQFSFDKYQLDCSLTEGKYPNYNSVIPQKSSYNLTIDKGLLLSALKRVSVCSSQMNNLLRLELANNQVNISAQDNEYSTSAEEMIIGRYEGDPLRIGFKAPFLIELINNIDTQEVSFGLTDPTRPGVITPVEGDEDVDMLMLLMPMMLK